MRYLVLAAFLVGCAEGESVLTAPDLGTGHLDGAAGEGGTVVPACDAPVETLSGRATYVAGSVRAVVPSEMSCVDAIRPQPTYADVVNGTVEVPTSSGGMRVTPVAMVGAAPSGTGCAYTLRLATTLASGGLSCDVTIDFLLAVP